jgi:hypothetical protein
MNDHPGSGSGGAESLSHALPDPSLEVLYWGDFWLQMGRSDGILGESLFHSFSHDVGPNR